MARSTGREEVLDMEAAAALLGIAPRTLRGWLQTKAIPHAKLGRDIRFLRSSLISWLKAQEAATMTVRGAGRQ